MIKINIFVPAMALQHPANPEGSELVKKIRMAIIRYHKNKNFYDNIDAGNSSIFVMIEDFKLNKKELGYDVSGYIKSA